MELICIMISKSTSNVFLFWSSVDNLYIFANINKVFWNFDSFKFALKFCFYSHNRCFMGGTFYYVARQCTVFFSQQNIQLTLCLIRYHFHEIGTTTCLHPFPINRSGNNLASMHCNPSLACFTPYFCMQILLQKIKYFTVVYLLANRLLQIWHMLATHAQGIVKDNLSYLCTKAH